MQLSKKELDLIEKNKSQFVSLKFIDENGVLKQIDSSVASIKDNLLSSMIHEMSLETIEGKSFNDPFRSAATTSFFCEDMSTKAPRSLSAKLLKESANELDINLSAEISFWIKSDSLDEEYIDRHANLRSDIISCLESININTSLYFKGESAGESVIGIIGENIIDLADNIIITKFIIANVVDGYAHQLKFSNDSCPNLTIISTGDTKTIDNIFSSIESNAEQISLFESRSSAYSFELKELQNYQLNDSKKALTIKLLSNSSFIPYFAFVELLLYEMDRKNINNQVLRYFNE